MSKNIKHVYVFGLGAIGAKYASMIYDVNPESVHVIVDETRKAKYSKNGVYVNGKKYDFDYVTVPPKDHDVDLLILGVKSLDLAETIDGIRDFVQENTVILSLLNGIGTTKILNTQLPNNPAIYSIVYMDAVKSGNHVTYGHRGKVVFGEANNETKSSRILALSTFFETMDIDHEIPEDMILALWRKFLINVVGNQLTYIINAGYEALQDNPYILNLVQAVGEEVIAIANAQGIALAQSDIDAMITTMRKIDPKAKTSMVQDREQLRASEVEIFAGEIIELGQQLQIPTPYNFMLYNLIKGYEFEQFERE